MKGPRNDPKISLSSFFISENLPGKENDFQRTKFKFKKLSTVLFS